MLTNAKNIEKYQILKTLKTSAKIPLVFFCVDIETGKHVVLKKFPPISDPDETKLNRFLNQNRINFEHPNIVPITEFFSLNDNHFIVSPYAESVTMREFYQTRKLRKKADNLFFTKVLLGALNGIKALHAREILHLDIRPQNILLCTENGKPNYENPQVKLIDFGSAKFPDDAPQQRPFAFVYSAPEQVLNLWENLDFSTDLYALAVSFYEILTREIPFAHSHPEMLVNLQLTQTLKPHKRIDSQLFEVLKKASFKHKFRLPPNRYSRAELIDFMRDANAQRYQSCDAMISDLQKTFNLNADF